MPIENMATYMAERRQLHREKAIAFRGGVCVDCRTTSDLEFDHVDPATKEFAIADMLAHSWERLVLELVKCELRCRPCHIERGRLLGQFGGGWNRMERRCGTAVLYNDGCRCVRCREWKRLYRLKLVDSRGKRCERPR